MLISLGLDIGSTNLKAVLLSIDADACLAQRVREVSRAAAPTPSSGVGLISVALRLIEEVTSDATPDCVGIASMAETGVPLDSQNVPLGDLVRWDAPLGSADADALTAAFGAGNLFAATGVRPSGKAPLAIWAYLRRWEPQRWNKMRRWAGAADLLALALTARLATDHTLAGRTMAYRLPQLAEPPPPAFDADLLAAVGLRPEQLPQIAGPGEIAGRVHGSAVGGLRRGTPVVVAGHDHQVGAWAAGVRGVGQVADSIGTAEAIIRIIGRRPDPEEVLQAGMSLVRTVSGTSEALVAGSPSAGAMVSWWAEQYCRGCDLDEALQRGSQLPGPAGIFVLPYLHGRQTPAPDPDAKPALIGAAVGRDSAELGRALLDGLSLHARWMLIEQARLAGASTIEHPVTVLGAAAAPDAPWLKVKATVGPANLECVQSREPVAAGAALLGATRSGLLAEDAAVLPCRPVPIRPDPAYELVYERFVQAALGDLQ